MLEKDEIYAKQIDSETESLIRNLHKQKWKKVIKINVIYLFIFLAMVAVAYSVYSSEGDITILYLVCGTLLGLIVVMNAMMIGVRIKEKWEVKDLYSRPVIYKGIRSKKLRANYHLTSYERNVDAIIYEEQTEGAIKVEKDLFSAEIINASGRALSKEGPATLIINKYGDIPYIIL